MLICLACNNSDLNCTCNSEDDYTEKISRLFIRQYVSGGILFGKISRSKGQSFFKFATFDKQGRAMKAYRN